MPKRTNDFQQLAYLIQVALAPSGAKITESFLWDGLREIDILIESAVGPHAIRIAVEAKNEKRPLDVGVIEQLIGKYQAAGGIPVNKVVLVARNGFTEKARARAAQANIDLLTLDEAKQSDWTKLVPQRLVWRMPPHIDRVELVPPVVPCDGKDPLADGRFVCKCHGKNKGTPLQWANWLLITQILPNASVAAHLDLEAKRRNGQVVVAIACPMTNYVFAFGDKKLIVEEIKVHIHYVSTSGPVKWSSFTVTGEDKPEQTIDQMEAMFGSHRMRIVFPNGPKSEKIVLKMDVTPQECSKASAEPHPETMSFATLPAARCPLHTPPARPMAQNVVRARRPSLAPAFAQRTRVGRNEQCPCKSGKKYKNCCLRKRIASP